MGLPQAGQDKLSSAFYHYQSLAMGLDRLLIGFTFQIKNRSFMRIVMGRTQLQIPKLRQALDVSGHCRATLNKLENKN